MVMEDVEKGVISPIESSTKTEKISNLNISFPWGYREKKHNLLLSTFMKNAIPSRKTVNELLKKYPEDLFNFDYLGQYWIFDIEEK